MSTTLIKCKDCGKEISREAKSCPGCGRLNNPHTSSEVIVLVFLSVLVIWNIANFHKNANPARSTPSGPSSLEACLMSHVFVEKRLRAPGSAKFSSCHNPGAVQGLGEGKFRVTGYVDAQNAFGALIRNNYVCVLRHVGGEGDKWQLEGLQLE